MLYFWLESHNWCHLPYKGGIYDQPAWLWEKLLRIGSYKAEWDREQEVQRELDKKVPAVVLHDDETMKYLAELPEDAGGEGE